MTGNSDLAPDLPRNASLAIEDDVHLVGDLPPLESPTAFLDAKPNSVATGASGSAPPVLMSTSSGLKTAIMAEILAFVRRELS